MIGNGSAHIPLPTTPRHFNFILLILQLMIVYHAEYVTYTPTNRKDGEKKTHVHTTSTAAAPATHVYTSYVNNKKRTQR